MWLTCLFGLCVIGIIIGLFLIRNRVMRNTNILLFFIGFIAGFGVEYWGVSTGSWEYHETDLFMISDIPIEILVAYGAGLFYLGILIQYLIRNYNEQDRLVVLKAFPLIGFFFLFISLLHHEIPWIVGLVFLSIWGLMISDRQSVPILAGLIAFFIDLIVEGFLTYFTNYYVWSIGVAVAFMLVAIFIAGILTRRKCNPEKGFCFVET